MRMVSELKSVSNKEIFASKGLKNTTQRNMVFDELRAKEGLMTAEEIYLGLKDQEASISLSTIYRILDLFVYKGMAVKTNISHERKAAYEVNPVEHRHYLICTNCNQNIPLKNCPLNVYEKALEMETEYMISGHNLVIYGCCPQCQRMEH